MSYYLTAKCGKKIIDQGQYNQLNQLLSRIKQLDKEYEFLELNRPLEYIIEVS